MKLSDMDKVRSLSKRRDYLTNLARRARSAQCIVSFDGTHADSIVKGIFLPAVVAACRQEIERVDADLRSVGVETDGGEL